MILSIIIAILTFILLMVWFVIPEGYGDLGSFVICTIADAALTALVFLLCLVLSICIGDNLDKTYALNKSFPIVALQDNVGVVGGFFLGTGSVDGKLYYYYAENNSRGYIANKVPADKSYILFDDDKPRVEYYEATDFKKKRHWIYAIPSGHYYSIYIPHGSLKQKFEINLGG